MSGLSIFQRHRVAGIGRRDINFSIFNRLKEIGEYIAGEGFELSSGNADGSDYAFASGASVLFPERVFLYLPWTNHNNKHLISGNNFSSMIKEEWVDVAATHHPKWNTLSEAERKFMIRNVGIVYKSKLVIAYPNLNKLGMGGTGHAMRVARTLKIPVLNLAELNVIEWGRAVEYEIKSLQSI